MVFGSSDCIEVKTKDETMKTSYNGLYFRGAFSSLAFAAMLIFASLGIVSCGEIKVLNSNAKLGALHATPDINETFSSNTLSYSITVESDATSLSITPRLADSDASLTIQIADGAKEASSSGIAKEINIPSLPFTIKVEVTAEDGDTTRTYIITVNDELSNNAFLSEINPSTGLFLPVITDGEVADNGYLSTASFISDTISFIPVLSDPNASMTLNGFSIGSGDTSSELNLIVGDNNMEIVVTAEDGVTTSTYRLNIKRSTVQEFAHHTYVKATNTDAGDEFGESIAMWGNTLVVGAPFESSNASDVNGDQTDNSVIRSGAAYVFVKDDDGLWSFQAYLKASNVGISVNFGEKVAISNDTIAIGSPNENSIATGINQPDQSSSFAPASGAVYVFDRDESNDWTQVAYIKSSNSESSDQFGTEIALSSTHLAVSAPFEDSNSREINGDQDNNDTEASGAVYVYAKDESNQWYQQAYIKPSNTDSGDLFGSSLALSGNTLAVGAKSEDSNATGIGGDQQDNSILGSGAVYVFGFDQATGWNQQSYIKSPNPKLNDHFGESIALSGNTLVVGEPDQDDVPAQIESWINLGAAHIFFRNETLNWTHQSTVYASNPSQSARFGESMYLSGDTLVVGSIGEGGNATGIDGVQFNRFSRTGAAYLFNKDEAGSWTQLHYIKASNTNSGDEFATTITGYSDDLVFSAVKEDSNAIFGNGSESNNSASNAGAGYIYRNAPFTNHNLALTTVAYGSSPDKISLVNLNTGLTLDDCSDNCSQLINRGQTVQLTPVAGSETSEFIKWKGDANCSSNVDSSGVSTVTVNGDLYCLAVFAEVAIEDIILTITKSDSSTADGLIQATNNSAEVVASCDAGCTNDSSLTLEMNSVIDIVATPEAGAFVSAWLGDEQCQANATGDNTTTSVTMSASKTCTAQFDLLGTSTLRFIVANSLGSVGQITATNTNTGETHTTCSADCSEQITIGHTVELFATPFNASSQFTGWSGDTACTANINPADTSSVVVEADTTCTASFTLVDPGEINITISKAVDQTGDGNIDAVFLDSLLINCPEGCTSVTSAEVDPDSFILLFATPNSLSEFIEWSGDEECSANASGTQTNVTLDVAKTCTAKFDFLPVN